MYPEGVTEAEKTQKRRIKGTKTKIKARLMVVISKIPPIINFVFIISQACAEVNNNRI